MRNFIRTSKLRLLSGFPRKEWRTGNYPNTINMEFEYTFSTKSTANNTKIKIFNLTQESVNTLNTPDNIFQLEAGYEHDSGLVAVGHARDINYKHDGTNSIHDFLLDERVNNKEITFESTANKTRYSIMREIIVRSGGIVGEIQGEDETFTNPEIYSGSFDSILSGLARDAGAFVVYADGKVSILTERPESRTSVFTLNKNSGLLTKPIQKDNLYSFNALYNYRYKKGFKLKVISTGIGIGSPFISNLILVEGKMKFSDNSATSELKGMII